jgi:hypothetical protein
MLGPLGPIAFRFAAINLSHEKRMSMTNGYLNDQLPPVFLF